MRHLGGGDHGTGIRCGECQRTDRPASLGPIFAASQWGALIGAFLFGPCADRWGRRRFLFTTCLLFSLLTLATAWAMGGGSGLIALAALAYPTFMRSTGIGWGLGWSRLGSAIGPLLAGMMVSASWSPARVFLALGLIGVANALVVALMGVVARSRRMAAAPA
jgi:MFS family permease